VSSRLPADDLPVELNSFVGRRRELSEIRWLLSTNRLVMLTGVGGVGKTRLALRAAAQARRSFADGVVLVELAGLKDPLLLPQAVSRALGIADQTARDQVEVLGEFLADRQVLLVVDNCEHLLPPVAHLMVDLLRAAPRLRILATSREPLLVPGEQLYPVAPLPVPGAEQPELAATVTRYGGVTLFVDRAAAVQPSFTVTDANAALVARLCRSLDGIPLAIELAAARLRVLSLEQVTDRLDDRFRFLTGGNRTALPRQQTLRAAVEWSFDLCSKQERLTWVRASVFAGGFDLEAAERICGGDGLPVGGVLEALGGLVAKSVLVVDLDARDRRYRLLDTLRRYGLERLRDPADAHHRRAVDEAELRRRHRDHYVALAERFHTDWFGPDQVTWSRRMHAERENLREALGFCLAGPDPDGAGLRLAGALHYLWYACGEVREGRMWLERLLAADPSPGVGRVRALGAYMRLLLAQGDHAAAAAVAGECRDLAGRFDEPAYAADALVILGIEELYRDEPAAALPMLAEAVDLARGVGAEHPEVAYAKVGLALSLLVLGDTGRAGEVLAESQAVCRARGDRWYLGLVMFTFALQALAIPDVARALAYGRESLRLRLGFNDMYGAGSATELLAWAAAADGDLPRAARLLGAADRLWHDVGGSPIQSGQLGRRRQVADAARAALGDAVFETEYRHGGDLTLDDAVAYALGMQQPNGDARVRPADDQPRLTRREAEVAALVAEGLTNKQIAARLVIAQRTAESHVENILSKLGFTSRTQIVAWYAQQRDLPE
jgi:non-specific serine/threonine protein kinase